MPNLEATPDSGAATPVVGNPPAGTKAERFARIKSEAGRLKDEAGDKARSAAEGGKSKAAKTLISVSGVARDAAEKLKSGKAEPVAAYVTDAADAIDRFANRMNEKSVDDMVDDARDVVRRSPVIAIGIAAAAGFALSRFLRSTSRDS